MNQLLYPLSVIIRNKHSQKILNYLHSKPQNYTYIKIKKLMLPQTNIDFIKVPKIYIDSIDVNHELRNSNTNTNLKKTNQSNVITCIGVISVSDTPFIEDRK